MARKDREGRTVFVPTTGVATFIQIMGPSTNRVCLTLFPPFNDFVLYTDDNNTSTTVGFALNANTGPLILDREVVGDIVCKPWFARTGTGGFIAWIETIDPTL